MESSLAGLRMAADVRDYKGSDVSSASTGVMVCGDSGGRRRYTISIVNANVDSNVGRVEGGYAYDTHLPWTINFRQFAMVEAMENLLRDRPTVFTVVELREGETKNGKFNSVAPIESAFARHGYRTRTVPYNLQPYSFQMTTAWNEELEYVKDYVRYLTRTPLSPTRHVQPGDPDPEAVKLAALENNYGCATERGVLVTWFRHKESGATIVSINVHCDIPLDHRLAASKCIVQFTEEILAEDPEAKVLVTGDFNSFQDWGGAEQIGRIRQALDAAGRPLLHEATESLTFENGEPCPFTFIPYPYDFVLPDLTGGLAGVVQELDERFRQETRNKPPGNEKNIPTYLSALDVPCRRAMIEALYKRSHALGGVLDRVFHRGFARVVKCMLLPMKRYAEPPIRSYTEKEVRHYVLAHHNPGPDAAVPVAGAVGAGPVAAAAGSGGTGFLPGAVGEDRNAATQASEFGPAFAFDHQPLKTVVEFSV